MMNSLDLLILTFAGLTAISLLALCLMFLVKNPTAKKVTFYILSILGMGLAWLNALMTPFTFPGELAMGWILGGLSAAALVIHLVSKTEKTKTMARVLAAVAVVGGMVSTFLI